MQRLQSDRRLPLLRRQSALVYDQLRGWVGQAGILLPLPAVWKAVYVSALAGRNKLFRRNNL